MQDNLEREKKVRADVEKAKRKLEQDLRQTQEAVEELERVKSELEDAGRKSVDMSLTGWSKESWFCRNKNGAWECNEIRLWSIVANPIKVRHITTLWVKKLDPFSFEDNFGKCCPILIILSPSQTEINYDQAHPKIYHAPQLKSASALPCKMNKNVLANVTGMIS